MTDKPKVSDVRDDETVDEDDDDWFTGGGYIEDRSINNLGNGNRQVPPHKQSWEW